MRLPSHDRFDFSPITTRKNYDWRGGKRLELYVALNVECFAFGSGLGHVIGTQLPPPDQRNWSWREYGNRIGFWRLLELFDELEMPACHLANSGLCDGYPEIIEAIARRGDEIIGHGRTNAERQGVLWEEDEARLIAEATEAVERRAGKRPRGWMGPMMSQSGHTPDLLKEAGYGFLMDWPCDDQPFWMKTRSGPLMVVPYPLEINDAPQILQLQHSAEAFAAMIGRQFEEMLRQSEKQPLVCAISLHTMIMGQPHRLNALREALRRIREHAGFDRVWLTRPGEIFDHCRALPPGTLPGG